MLEEFFNTRVGSKLTSLIGFIFPFCQANAFFGQQVLCTTDNAAVNIFFKTHLVGPLMGFYFDTWNYLAVFAFEILLFDICVRKRYSVNSPRNNLHSPSSSLCPDNILVSNKYVW